MQETNDLIINAVGEGNIQEILSQIEDKFVDTIELCHHGRELKKEGQLKRITRKGPVTYYFHLFSDLLLYSERTVDNKFKLHRKINLSKCLVVNNTPDVETELVQDSVVPTRERFDSPRGRPGVLNKEIGRIPQMGS
eukprot:TRINITY_DN3939_c0_g1_i1.p1 TRINITY_DN3939_c0_g1~~TRINITY_DN3939_c0_g1_i1.p1  ORF type:complete len:137 (-),score=19.40 TRINITY_DN3939_c0_g1_i1:84-494(-)